VWKGPLVVLVSRLSASASEILAGAIQDYHRGLIVGDHATHGKGTVQSLTDLRQAIFDTRYGDKMGSLKITMQQFYRPSGESTQLRGVLADVEIPSRFALFDVGEGDLDYAIPFDRIEPDAFRPFNLVNKSIAERLSQLSVERRAKSPEFQQLLRRIARAEEQKKRKRVTLNEQKYLAERAEWNAEKDEEKLMEEMSETRKNEIKEDYYLKEVLAITGDYLHLLPPDGSRTLQAVQASKAAGKDN
jgi:carboxyl-terminal processing protease